MRLLGVLTASVLLAVPAAAHAGEGEIIVQRAPGSSAREVRQDAGVRLVDTLPIARTELVAPADGDVAEALAALRADDDVVAADLVRRVSVAAPTNDPFWISLWALDNAGDTDINVPEAWQRSLGDDVTVAVVDTGINAAHEDLRDQLATNPGERGRGRESNGVDDDGNGFIDDYRGWDFVSEDNVPQDGNGHGSHVAGTIAAAAGNGVGIVGVAPHANVLALRALDNNGSGWMSDIAAAFAYAGDNGARIVNASLGGGYASVVENVIRAHPDTLYVVAAGNDNVDNDNAHIASYPCALTAPNVVCVGATDQLGQRASFSNWGAKSVDLFAPGVLIRSASHTAANAYKYLSGTSMATPHVAGVAALELAVTPYATASQLKWALLSSAAPKPALAGKSVTGGYLDAQAAVAAISGQSPAAVPAPEPPATPISTPTPTPTATPIATPTATPAPPEAAPPAETPVPVTPVAPVPDAPAGEPAVALTHLKVGGSLATKRGKLKVTFSLSRSAKVRFTVARRGKRLATWTKRGVAGRNSVTLTRRLPTGRTLKAGTYTLAVGLTANAKSAAAIRVR